MTLSQIVKSEFNKDIKSATAQELYAALQKLIRNTCHTTPNGKKKLYYISAEFLIGRLLSNNLINSGLYEEVKQELYENGRSIEELEALENEPSLGNGGLGRLAACFLDSIATLNLNGDGVGLLYHFGLFKQIFDEKLQKTIPDKWLSQNSIVTKTDRQYKIDVMGETLTARMYDIDIYGYGGGVNKLHLFDLETVNENIVTGGIDFDKTDISENLTLFLYPDDSDENGRLLRVCQQYFMVSCAARLIIDECKQKGASLHKLYEYAVIQINDTHPTMIILELVRLLTEEGIAFDEAVEIVQKTCAYTNHTILAEALEKWHILMLRKAVPQLVPIIEILDSRIRRRFCDERLYIIDNNDVVHMANICIHCCFCVNGVAELHTEILKNTELSHFYAVYPEKFQNKTNGITFRRWLYASNPQLTALIKKLIGEDFTKDELKLRELLRFSSDRGVLASLINVKQNCKRSLCEYLRKTQNVSVSESFIFDIQIKRMHEYKRQQLNALYVIHKYLEIKSGQIPENPVCVIFGGKAAPAYTIAQDIIHLILCLSELVNNDNSVNRYLRVVMVPNYNVSLAQKLIPACDISQQISLASKEASGTGNMKLMLNGAVTLGTMDGANVEIAELVGKDNIYIFGDDSETVVNRYKSGSYSPIEYYEKSESIKRSVDFIVSDTMQKIGSPERLKRLYSELLNKDWFMTFPDFESYVKVREKAYCDYSDRASWAKKMLSNIANAGYFSSDRTITEYNRDIWKL